MNSKEKAAVHNNTLPGLTVIRFNHSTLPHLP
eukprot:CAMPEP_0171936048 /NCGR_PEP_ID=MMETSP0993-20121228/33502_1 /TAXON_ID=483369 /ORGANISM="non described non described, Strain CCMP2098" /LENGTH=31 /DNA_ID= /DNA_START= /DNA_END= /DNA_ORIENTATION=